MMRIAVVVPGFSRAADDWAIPALLTLAQTLAKAHEIHIFSQRYPAKGLYQFDGLTHHALGGGQKFGLASLKIWLQTSRAIIDQHQKNPFDLLHALWVDEAGFSAALAAAIIKRPVLASIGGGELSRLAHINYGAQRFLSRRFTTRYALKKARVVTAGSTYQLDMCRAYGIPERKLRLAPLGVDTSRFRPTDGEAASSSPGWGLMQRPTIIQAASLLPVKNQARLLEILNLIKKEIPEIRLNLAGSGPLQANLSNLARKLNLSANIYWHQHVTYPAMPGLYRQSHLYLQTSDHESQGMAVLEAMACGLPVVGTPVGVVKDIACRPPHPDAGALARQIIEILGDEAGYAALRRQARQIAEDKFSLPVTTGTFLKIYESMHGQ